MAVQWLRLDASTARGKVQSLVEEETPGHVAGQKQAKSRTR